MKNKFVSLLGIILGIIIIAFPMIGVIGTSSLIGLSVLLISIYLLVAGVAIIDYNKSGAIIDLILGIILLFLSLGLIFNPNLFAFLAEISLYLAGIVLIIVGVVALVNNRHARFGFYRRKRNNIRFTLHYCWYLRCRPYYSRYFNRIMVSNNRCFKNYRWLTPSTFSFFGVEIDSY